MRRRMPILVAALITISLLFVSLVEATGNQDPNGGKPNVVAALGIAKVQGQDAIVEVIVVVPPGQDVREAALEALRQQGARPFESAGLGSEGFTVTGLVWDFLPVVQNYNPRNEPASLNGLGALALTNTHGTWDRVATSSFDINFGEETDRCPSLVRECPGPQSFDGNNDVAWLGLQRNVLGVTWYSTTIGESDMALSTSFNWATDFDAETVFLHENGDVVGLGHSSLVAAVMYPSYQEGRLTLHQDDKDGATFLYDSAVTGSVSGTVMDGTSPIGGATVVLEGTSLQATTASDGSYTIGGVPDPVTYTVTASADGFDNDTIVRLTIDGATAANFSLAPSGGEEENGGGPPPCKGKNKNDPGC